MLLITQRIIYMQKIMLAITQFCPKKIVGHLRNISRKLYKGRFESKTFNHIQSKSFAMFELTVNPSRSDSTVSVRQDILVNHQLTSLNGNRIDGR